MDPTQLAWWFAHPVVWIGLMIALAVGVGGALLWRRRAPEVSASVQLSVGAEVGVLGQLRSALARTGEALRGRIDVLFGAGPIDESVLEQLEEVLIQADVGMPTAQRLIEPLRAKLKAGPVDAATLRGDLRLGMRALLGQASDLACPVQPRPFVVLVVGVNGSGKTTTIGKLARRYRDEGHTVLLAAADTFRAAAIDQLKIWAERAGADIVAHQEGGDPGAVVFDALTAAVSRGADVVIIDTAGRLQTKKPLMEQLTKIRRVVDKVVPGGPHETLLVIDGTMGQNALSQARLFHEATPLTGVVVTKLDGTAKGGVVLALASELGLGVRMIGVGERTEDLRAFDPDMFIAAIA